MAVPRGACKETRRLVDAARNAGAEVSFTGSGHWKVTMPGVGTAFISATPGDQRSIRNEKAKLRRLGIDV